VGTAATPVTRMLPIAGRLWCGCHNAIKILNTTSLEVEVRLRLDNSMQDRLMKISKQTQSLLAVHKVKVI
jgi:hypothetical protein